MVWQHAAFFRREAPIGMSDRSGKDMGEAYMVDQLKLEGHCTWRSLMSMLCTSVKSLAVMTTSGSSVLPDSSRAATPSLSMHPCHRASVSMSLQLHLDLPFGEASLRKQP